MAALSPNFDPQFDDGGAPAAGYLLHTYETGTTTPLTTYQDQAATVPNTNPIVLDAAGRAKLWLVDSAEYRLHLTTPLGATVSGYPIDDVGGVSTAIDNTALDAALRAELASTASGKGAALVGYKRNAVSAAARLVSEKLGDFVSVKDFGAIGDGVADDTAALQAAIDYCVDSALQFTWLQFYRGSDETSSAAIKLWVPSGEYKISATLRARGALYMEGDGDLCSLLVQAATFSGSEILAIGYTTGAVYTDFLWTLGGRVANIKILGSGKTKTGIYSWRQHLYTFENVRVSGCAVGIELHGGYSGLCSACTVQHNTIGVRSTLANAPPPIYDEPNDITFLRCNNFDNVTGYVFGDNTNFNVIGGVIQGNTGSAINCTAVVRTLKIDGLYFEANNTGSLATAYIVGTIRNLTISDSFLNQSSKTLVDATNITSISIKDCDVFNTGTIVLIPGASNIEYLSYENVQPSFSITMGGYLIDNQKSGFCPGNLLLKDFRTTTSGTYGYSEQLKRAFNGSQGTVVLTKNEDIRWTVDFPLKITSASRDVGIVSTISGATALTIDASDVCVDSMRVSATGAAAAISIGAAATVKRVDVLGCRVTTGSPATGCLLSSATASDGRIEGNTWERTSVGRSVTIHGANNYVAGNRYVTNATSVVLEAASVGNKVILTGGESLTNLGAGNASL